MAERMRRSGSAARGGGNRDCPAEESAPKRTRRQPPSPREEHHPAQSPSESDDEGSEPPLLEEALDSPAVGGGPRYYFCSSDSESGAEDRDQADDRAEPEDGEGEGEEEEEEEEAVYAGATDADGLPHGRGSLDFVSSGGRFEGHFIHGRRCGRGTLYFPQADDSSGDELDGGDEDDGSGDDEDDGGDAEDVMDSKVPATQAHARQQPQQQQPQQQQQQQRRPPPDFLSGWWEGEQLADGMVGEYCSPADGVVVRGPFVDGSLHGDVVEERSLEDDELLYRGAYRHNRRHGPGVQQLPDGQWIEGEWRHGQLHGPKIRWHLTPPALLDWDPVLCGRWECGSLVAARMERPSPSSATPGLETASTSASTATATATATAALDCDTVFSHDPPTESRISRQPLLADPLESLFVRVGPSRLAGAGEGLFARAALPPGLICSYYSGILVSQEAVDARDWALNDNTITLEEHSATTGVVIDVPAEWASTQRYCATLGHKANHSARPNAKYDRCLHPRFGHIKCIRTLEPVAAGEEITVDYGYELAADAKDARPPWFETFCASLGIPLTVRDK